MTVLSELLIAIRYCTEHQVQSTYIELDGVGLRLGSSAATTRGLGQTEFEELSDIIADTLISAAEGNGRSTLRQRVDALCARFPIYDFCQ